MNNSQTSSQKKVCTPWAPPESFSLTSEEAAIFLVDKEIGRQKQTPQPFSLAPMNVEESLALSAWEDEPEDITEGNFMDKNSISSHSSDTNTFNTYDDDAASVTTCSTTTTTSDFPPVIHITMAELIRRKPMRDNNYNSRIIGTTPVNDKGKKKLVNFKDEIESSGGSLRNSVDLSSSSVISNDSSTIKDNNSSLHSEISVIPSSSSLSRITREEFEAAKLEKQKSLRAWVKLLWPQPRLPTPRQLTNGLTPRSLLDRNLNPLTIGIITSQKSVPMILTAIVKGTRHSAKLIEGNGQIKFMGEPELIKGVYDPREYLLLHCPTYHNPPYYNDDPRISWTDHFLLNKVLPRLAEEATRIQNEIGLYLTVKETWLRGLGQHSLYQCKLCPSHFIRKFNYKGIYDHLLNSHPVRQVYEEEMIKVDLREYVSAFYKNLPPKIIFEQ